MCRAGLERAARRALIELRTGLPPVPAPSGITPKRGKREQFPAELKRSVALTFWKGGFR